MAAPVKRNVVLVGHSNCGKTMLAETLLFQAGAVTRMGSITDGSTVSDSEPDEKERQASIDSAVLHYEWEGADVNVIDTPGYPDFIGQMIPSARAADIALICVSAAAGVEVNTRKAWEVSEDEGIPKAIIVTKMDGDNANFDTCVSQVQEAFGSQCKPFVVPRGAADGLEAVDSVLAGDGGDRDSLVESIVEADEALLEKYLEGGEVSDAELGPVVTKAMMEGSLVPILATAAEKEIGVKELADFISTYVPGPADRRIPLAEGADAPSNDALTGQVFKIVTDAFVGKMSYVRVFTGTIASSSSITNARTGSKNKTGQLMRMQGKEQEPIDSASAGDILCIAKVEDLEIADTVTDDSGGPALAGFKTPQPMVSLAVEPKKRGDEAKISGSFSKLAQEDLTFKVTRDVQTHEMVVTGMSNLHLDIMLGRLKTRFDVEVDTKQPKIPYKETITKGAQGHHKHKKQTGGRGQYGDVHLRVAPLERGAGFQFGSEVVGGNIPTQYIPAIEKGIKESLVNGIVAGYPIEDVEVMVTDGSYHDVDSSEAAFKMAGKKAFRDAFSKARPCVLEPIVDIHVSAPLSHMGEITGDLNGRRGRIIGIDSQGAIQTINAQVPLSEVTRYSAELRSTTGGEGYYTLEFSHYDIVPAQLTAELIAKKSNDKEEE